MDYKELIKKQIEQLPDDLRSYVVDGDWSEVLESLLVKYIIEEYKKIIIENELFLVLIGLEPYRDLQINIQNEANLDLSTAEKISNDITENILRIKPVVNNSTESASTNNVGSDFEQIILNQARAMQPAIPPENLPVEKKPGAIHDYKPGTDPYREAVE